MTRKAWALFQLVLAVIVLAAAAIGLLSFHAQRFHGIRDGAFVATLARFDQIATLLVLSTLPVAALMLTAGIRVFHDRGHWRDPMVKSPLYGAVLLAYVAVFAACAAWLAVWLMQN